MSEDYKIFYNDKVVILTHKISKSFDKNDGLFYKYVRKEELAELLNIFQHFKEIKKLYILHDDTSHLFELVKSFYTIIEAAGGIVKRKDGKILSILRLGKWDLPKGKVDKGELYIQTALREVKEECGLNDLKTGRKLAETYHVYTEKNKTILKRTIWYEMDLNSDEKPVVQTSENITDYMWFDTSNVKEIMNNTYESLKDILVMIMKQE